MSEENVEIVRAFYEAFNRRLFDDALQYLHPECETYPALPAPGESSHYRGREEARVFLELIRDAWEAMTVELKEIIEAPDGRILAVERWRARWERRHRDRYRGHRRLRVSGPSHSPHRRLY